MHIFYRGNQSRHNAFVIIHSIVLFDYFHNNCAVLPIVHAGIKKYA
jgi:hypothetical protein